MAKHATPEPQGTGSQSGCELDEPAVVLDYLDYPHLCAFLQSLPAKRLRDRLLSLTKRELLRQAATVRSRKSVEYCQIVAEIDRVMRRFGDRRMRNLVRGVVTAPTSRNRPPSLAPTDAGAPSCPPGLEGEP